MKKRNFEDIWNSIDDDLAMDYQEINKDALHKAIDNLPIYEAPEWVWHNIEQDIKPKKLQVFFNVLKIAALILIVFSIGLFVNIKLNSSSRIQFAKAEQQSFSLQSIADTSDDIFLELKNSTCKLTPDFCSSESFKAVETEYYELKQMQADILNSSAQYEGGAYTDDMLLKIENRKKAIQQQLLTQLN